MDSHKILSQCFLDNDQQLFQSIFSCTCSWLKIKCLGVPDGFSAHRKSLFSLPVLTVIYISTVILQNFSELFLTGFFPFLYKGEWWNSALVMQAIRVKEAYLFPQPHLLYFNYLGKHEARSRFNISRTKF